MNEHEHVRKGIWCVAEGCNGAQYVDGVWMLPESWVVPEAPLRALVAEWRIKKREFSAWATPIREIEEVLDGA